MKEIELILQYRANDPAVGYNRWPKWKPSEDRPGSDQEDALFAELERRRAERESGRDPGIPADELFRRLRENRSTPSEES